MDPESGTQPNITRNLAALILGAVAIGFAPIFVRLSETGPVATGFWRISLALPMLFVLTIFSERGKARPSRTDTGTSSARGSGSMALWTAGLCFAFDIALWHWSIHFTTVANATLEANLSAIFVSIFAWLIYRQTVSRRFIVGSVIAFAGTALLVGKNLHVSPVTLKGDALGVLTAVFYSGYILAVKSARDQGFGATRIMLTSGVITAAALLPVILISGEKILPATAHGWMVVGGLALLSHVIGQSLIAFALVGLPASFAAVGLLVQPATAAVAAWAILGESLSGPQLVGAALLLAGIYQAKRG